MRAIMEDVADSCALLFSPARPHRTGDGRLSYEPASSCRCGDLAAELGLTIIAGVLIGITIVTAGTGVGVPIAAGGTVVVVFLVRLRMLELNDFRRISDSADEIFRQNERLANEITQLEEQVVQAEKTVEDLKQTNAELRTTSTELLQSVRAAEEQAEKLRAIVAIVDGKVENVREAEARLFELYDAYKTENDRHSAINALQLFAAADTDGSGALSMPEAERVAEQCTVIFGVPIVASALATTPDHKVTFAAFNAAVQLALKKSNPPPPPPSASLAREPSAVHSCAL